MNENSPPTDSPSIESLFEELGIAPDYGHNPFIRPRYAEAELVLEAGPNLLGRMQRLSPEALGAWDEMRVAAAGDNVMLLLVSGFRSIIYQADIIRNKLNQGQSISEILQVSAAPGYSQHHTGRALDIASPGTRPLTEEFETSPAFAWLSKNAEKYGFSMTYPQGNPAGFVFEPWHWALKC